MKFKVGDFVWTRTYSRGTCQGEVIEVITHPAEMYKLKFPDGSTFTASALNVVATKEETERWPV